MAIKTPNQGYLNSNRKTSERHPDFRAEVGVDSKFIKGLADAAKDGGAVIYMAGWKGVSKRDGEPYVFLRLASEKYQPPADKNAKADFAAAEDTPF